MDVMSVPTASVANIPTALGTVISYSWSATNATTYTTNLYQLSPNGTTIVQTLSGTALTTTSFGSAVSGCGYMFTMSATNANGTAAQVLSPTLFYAFSLIGGPQGVQGNPGVQGLQGAQGPTGSQGPPGIQGILTLSNYSTGNALITTQASGAGAVYANNNVSVSSNGVLSMVNPTNPNLNSLTTANSNSMITLSNAGTGLTAGNFYMNSIFFGVSGYGGYIGGGLLQGTGSFMSIGGVYNNSNSTPTIHIASQNSGASNYVGINNSNPAYTLDVSGNAAASTSIVGGSGYLGNLGANSATTFAILGFNSSNQAGIYGRKGTNNSYAGLDFVSYINTVSTTVMTISPNDARVGINCNAPVQTLDVGGTLGLFTPSDGASPTGTTRFAMYTYSNTLNINPRTSTGAYNSIVGLVMASNGNVGINCNAPAYTLDVNGTAQAYSLLAGASPYTRIYGNSVSNTIGYGMFIGPDTSPANTAGPGGMLFITSGHTGAGNTSYIFYFSGANATGRNSYYAGGRNMSNNIATIVQFTAWQSNGYYYSGTLYYAPVSGAYITGTLFANTIGASGAGQQLTISNCSASYDIFYTYTAMYV
jgi:hypothetical protein